MTVVKWPLIAPALFHGKKVGIFVSDFKDFSESWNKIVDRYGLDKEGGLILHKDETKKVMRFVGGGVLEIWSIGNEGRKESGRGRKYHRIIYEETQKIPDRVLKYHWENVSRPCLTDYKGDAYFIGTAAGKNNYWYKLCQRGARNGSAHVNEYGDEDLIPKNESDSWCTHRMPTSANPYIDPDEIADAKNDLDRLTYEQEYMCVFVDYDGDSWVYVLKDKELQQKVFQFSRPIRWSDQLYLSFDFNKIPMTALVMQKQTMPIADVDRTRYKYGVHFVKEFKIGSIEQGEASIYDTCRAIREWVLIETGRKIGKWGDQRFPCSVPFLITGDASGNRSDGRQKVPKTYYQIIQDEIQIPVQKIVVPKANPLHAESYVQTNTIISQCPNIKIYEDTCPNLRLDTLRIKSDNNRRIIKGKGEERQADLLDNLRYLFNTFCKDIKI